MKTVIQALIDEVYYPIPRGFVENVLIKRGFDSDDEPFYPNTAESNAYKGAVADCLCSLLQAVNFSEADKSVGTLSDEAKKKILLRANAIYKEIGEDEVVIDPKPTVYINC